MFDKMSETTLMRHLYAIKDNYLCFFNNRNLRCIVAGGLLNKKYMKCTTPAFNRVTDRTKNIMVFVDKLAGGGG
jgi:hypothetical protein